MGSMFLLISRVKTKKTTPSGVALVKTVCSPLAGGYFLALVNQILQIGGGIPVKLHIVYLLCFSLV